MSLWLLTKPWEDPSCRIEYLLGKLNLLVLPSKYLLTVSRISEISMEVAEPGRITAVTPPAHLIEKCDCPPGYSGLSCEVSWLQLTCLSPTYLTSWMEILPGPPLGQSVYFQAYPQPTLFDLPLIVCDCSKKKMMLLLEVGLMTQGKYLIKIKRFVKIWNRK